MNCNMQELSNQCSKIDKILEIIKDEDQSSKMTILSTVIDEVGWIGDLLLGKYGK